MFIQRLWLSQHDAFASLGLDVFKGFENVIPVLHFDLLDDLNFVTFVSAGGTEIFIEDLHAFFEGKIAFGGNVEDLSRDKSVYNDSYSTLQIYLECNVFPVRRVHSLHDGNRLLEFTAATEQLKLWLDDEIIIEERIFTSPSRETSFGSSEPFS